MSRSCSLQLSTFGALFVMFGGLCPVVTGCTTFDALTRSDAPKQRGKSNPVNRDSKRRFRQRARDCYEMPSAKACYDLGLNYELGLATPVDVIESRKYYKKACEIDKRKEHCEAFERMRSATP